MHAVKLFVMNYELSGEILIQNRGSPRENLPNCLEGVGNLLIIATLPMEV